VRKWISSRRHSHGLVTSVYQLGDGDGFDCESNRHLDPVWQTVHPSREQAQQFADQRVLAGGHTCDARCEVWSQVVQSREAGPCVARKHD
jgi:hypothetical protein